MSIYDFINNTFNSESVFFEIGCHFGTDTKKLLQVTKNLHCFEPDPRNIKIFKEKIQNIKINEFAISNKDGEIEFYLSSGNVFESKYGPTSDDFLNKNDWSASSSIKKPKNHLINTPWVKFKEKIIVKTKKLDTYCLENNVSKIDFIWMDVQGAELDVFEGCKNSLGSIQYIYTEYSDNELYEGQATKTQILNFLGDNWVLVSDYGGDILLKNKNY